MSGFRGRWRWLGLIWLVTSILAGAQNLPDAPQPKTAPPTNPFPDAPPAPKNNHPTPDSTSAPSEPEPQPQAPGDVVTSRNDLFRIVTNVTFIEVPVTVKDHSGKLVEGLSYKDFTVYEDGVPQKLSFFNSEPFPLSAAVVVDTNLPAGTMKKVNETLPALIGAFSEFDEVALYRYGNSVQQIAGFTGSNDVSTSSLERLKRTGRAGGAPVLGGPLGPQGPSVNGRPV